MSNARSQPIIEMFPLVPDREGWERPKYAVHGKRKYRGKIRYVAGYSHSRLYSHHLTGKVHDRILGYGDTQQAATDMMRRKLQTARSSEEVTGE